MTAPLDLLGEGLADRYRLERQVGAGGMATVYLAHDLRHDRKVAIKVLHPELAAVIGADRFLAEIRTTASLQHPHILPLFDSGAIAATGAGEARLLFYVMPFIEGESLRQRLTRERQLPVPDAVRIASEVAGALDYAHRKGIVHRDIKPENVLLHDGSALVADFGIALAVTAAGGGRLTQTGLSLGTPAYMSPEQAMGEREIGPRSDVYALGAVTYEMLSGEPPFTGPTSQAIVARTLTEQPRPLRSERKSIPPDVEAAVLRALEKLPADRAGSAREFAEELAGQRLGATRTAATTVLRSSSSLASTARWPLVAAGLTLAAVAFVGGRAVGRSGVPGVGPSGPVEFLPVELGTVDYFSVSQDGQFIVGTAPDSNGVSRVVLRRLDDAQATVLPNTENSLRAWLTPDNRSLVLRKERSLRIQPLSGGSGRDLLPVDGYVTVEWVAGDSMLVVVEERLLMVPIDGTPARTIATLDSGTTATFYIPRVLPGGRNILVGKRFSIDSVQLFQLDLRTGEQHFVHPNVQEVRPYAPDRLLWLDGSGRVMYGTYDQQAMKFGERQVVLDEGIDDLFANGDIIALRPGQPKRDLLLRSAGNNATERIATPDTSASLPVFSADGNRLAVLLTPLAVAQRVNNPNSTNTSVWVIDRRTGLRVKAIDHGADMAWFPDGERLLVLRWYPAPRRSEMWIARVDGSAPPEQVPSRQTVKFGPSLTPDGSAVVYVDQASRRLELQPVSGGPARVLFDDPGEEFSPVFSPDGRWLLYGNEGPDGAFAVARAWPALDRRVILAPVGFCPHWWGDGGARVYHCTADGTLAHIGFDPVTGRITGVPQPIPFVTQKNPLFAVTPRGNDLAWIPAAPRYGTAPRVLANWRGDAERRLAGGGK